MRYHILNGDALQERFPFERLDGEVVIIREAFIDGPVSEVYDSTFWSRRKKYIQAAYEESAEAYDDRVMSELNRLQEITAADEVYLWFEDDLFCQCNMWFAVDFISKRNQPKFYRVFPEGDGLQWKGFGFANEEDLLRYFNQVVVLAAEDIFHLRNLWRAFVASDHAGLKELGEIPVQGIRVQKEVIQAQLERTPYGSGLGRPQRTLSALMKDGQLSFYSLFEKFSEQEGIYGFGDAQVRNMMKEIEIQ